MDGSEWRCTHRIVGAGGYSEECSVTMTQQDMEEHLRVTHRLNPQTPDDVRTFFVLVRSVDPRGPGRRGKVEDQTMEMFTKGDFR